ncbi:lipolysis-stimulated lipoprotein receptor isoform X2 [Erythrolamprus reginae]|uniref:lipolysis-stimulated lipoprotein receptor isoform X2 n=1 Tax=Erythrolamprus reginae TaxID=121349 RepID=UPI00396C466F
METWRTRRVAGALPLLWLLGTAWILDSATAMQVSVLNPFNVAILFQPVTLQCNYQTTATQPPIVLWKYKSYCRSRIADAFNPGSQESQLNNQLQANNPGYNPYVECQDNARTVRVVATKQGNAVTLGDFYQGRRITIINDADLSIEQTAWGDSGVYYCTVTSSQDLQGNNEAYAELLVLDWVFVVLVVLAFFLVFLLLGICWCQCCPHTCCCYLRCPCCPEKCCCPEALYVAGKAATSGVPSVYAPSVYASSNQLKSGPPATMIPMGPIPPMYNGYGVDYDRASSIGGNSSQVPLLRDTESVANAAVRSGYRIQANQQDDSMRVLYYMEKELANFDPTRPGQPNGRLEKASVLSELSSLHEDDRRYDLRQGLGRLRGQAMSPISDLEEESIRSSENRRLLPPTNWRDRYEDSPPRSHGRRPRSRSVDALDDYERDSYYPPQPRGRGQHSSDNEYHHRDYSPDSRYDSDRYGRRRSRSRDDLRDLERTHYDNRLLEEALQKKQRAGSREDLDHRSASSGRSGHRSNRDEESNGFPPPPPPPYTETESVSSRSRDDRKLRRNHAVSRESLVV